MKMKREAEWRPLLHFDLSQLCLCVRVDTDNLVV